MRGLVWTGREVFDSLAWVMNRGLGMSRRRIGQETFAFGNPGVGGRCSLDDLHDLIDWVPIERRLAVVSSSVKGEIRQGRAGVAAAGAVQGDAACDVVRAVGREAC